MTEACVQETGGIDRIRERVGGGNVVLPSGLEVESLPRVADSRMNPSAQLPLVDGQLDLAAAISSLLQDSDGAADVVLWQIGHHHDFLERLSRSVPTAMECHEVEIAACLLEHRQHRFACRQGRGTQLQVFVHDQHHLRRLADQWSPFLRSLVLHLPGGQVLVANAPVTDIVRLLIAVGDALQAILPNVEVAVFHPIAHSLDAACPRIGDDVRLASYLAAPFHELIRAECVGFLHTPCLVKHRLAVRPHAFAPVVGRSEASSWPTHQWNLQFLHGLYHIGSKAVLVREWVARAEDASVNLIVEMLDELPKQHAVVLNLFSARLYNGRILGCCHHSHQEDGRGNKCSFHNANIAIL